MTSLVKRCLPLMTLLMLPALIAAPTRSAAQTPPGPAAPASLPAASLYMLRASWTSHQGRTIDLLSLRGEVVVLAMGPASVPTNLRKGLAMGADRAIHILDDALIGADTTLTATTLAAALSHEGFDLVIAGNVSTDGGGAVIPSMVAELLDVPAATGLSTVTITATDVTGRRDTEVGSYTVKAALPAVVSRTTARCEQEYKKEIPKHLSAGTPSRSDTTAPSSPGILRRVTGQNRLRTSPYLVYRELKKASRGCNGI